MRLVELPQFLEAGERDRDVETYDGEVWSWSPAELNRIAYVDGNGDEIVTFAFAPTN